MYPFFFFFIHPKRCLATAALQVGELLVELYAFDER